MSKMMRCKDVGMDCDFVARGENEDEVMGKAADHARKDHELAEIPEDLAKKVKAAIHDE